MSNDNGNFGSFFAGLVLGGLIGAGVALSLIHISEPTRPY